MKLRLWICYLAAGLAGFGLGALTAQDSVRFDHIVRNDFFAGFLGDAAALERAMKTCEKVLAENPKHAEALVWHGAGLYYQSGRAFQAGDQPKGMELAQKGLAEMDRAVELEPDAIGVRIPRGASLLAAARNMPPQVPIREQLFRRALEDHERAFNLQKDGLDQLGQHPLGELLQALGDVHSRLGNAGKAQDYYEMILKRLPNTEYARRAALWLETKQPLPANQAACVGCHTGR